MYEHLLIATDGSELAHKAVVEGLALAKSLETKVTFVTATPHWSSTEMASRAERGAPHPVEDYEQRATAWANDVLDACKSEAREAGLDCKIVHANDKQPAEGIIEAARSQGCDLIVMASHGRSGIGQLLLGSVATKVLTHSAIPVLLCR